MATIPPSPASFCSLLESCGPGFSAALSFYAALGIELSADSLLPSCFWDYEPSIRRMTTGCRVFCFGEVACDTDLEQWFSTFLRLPPFNTAHAAVTPNHKTTSLLLYHCNFAIVNIVI